MFEFEQSDGGDRETVFDSERSVNVTNVLCANQLFRLMLTVFTENVVTWKCICFCCSYRKCRRSIMFFQQWRNGGGEVLRGAEKFPTVCLLLFPPKISTRARFLVFGRALGLSEFFILGQKQSNNYSWKD